MDSTMFMPNIKKAGRIAPAYDVLVKAIKAIPKHKLPEELKAVLEPKFKTETLYQTRPSESSGKMDQLLNLCHLGKHSSGKAAAEARRIVSRFLKEQADYDESSGRLKAKSHKEISPRSLQSAYEKDCTFRSKNGKSQSGYVANFAETCAAENPIQQITDYAAAPNVTAATILAEERLPIIKRKAAFSSHYQMPQ